MSILPMLRTIRPDQVTSLQRSPFDADTLATAERLVRDVAHGGEPALRQLAERVDDLAPNAPDSLRSAADALAPNDRRILEDAAARIRRFADAQRAAWYDFEIDAGIPGASIVMGQRVLPVGVVGCYAPGGRHPLPSSVLMTAVTARAAGVTSVVVASPRPTTATLAAAHGPETDADLNQRPAARKE